MMFGQRFYLLLLFDSPGKNITCCISFLNQIFAYNFKEDKDYYIILCIWVKLIKFFINYIVRKGVRKFSLKYLLIKNHALDMLITPLTHYILFNTLKKKEK